jgi:hypothetical protein
MVEFLMAQALQMAQTLQDLTLVFPDFPTPSGNLLLPGQN